MNIYLDLTHRFNEGHLRAVLSSGQAVVLHRLAIMSKDGDWILREDDEAVDHVLRVLAEHGARYRFGAPLDPRWLAGGWSAHFQFQLGELRVRTDFVSRPPRLSSEDLEQLWLEQAGREPPFVGVRQLIALKQTNREKDYAVIGDLARLLPNPRDQLLASRSARDILALTAAYPDLAMELTPARPVLGLAGRGREALEAALDAERRVLMRANEDRLARYARAAQAWSRRWPVIQRATADIPLPAAHALIRREAEGVLPFAPPAPEEVAP